MNNKANSTGDWSHRRSDETTNTGVMNDRYWSHKQWTDTGAMNNRYWSLESQATGDTTGATNERQRIHWSHKQQTDTTGAMNDRRSILEPQDEEKTTTTGATNDKYWRLESQERWHLLEPQATTDSTGATNDRQMLPRQLPEPQTTDTGATRQDDRYWSHKMTSKGGVSRNWCWWLYYSWWRYVYAVANDLQAVNTATSSKYNTLAVTKAICSRLTAN